MRKTNLDNFNPNDVIRMLLIAMSDDSRFGCINGADVFWKAQAVAKAYLEHENVSKVDVEQNEKDVEEAFKTLSYGEKVNFLKENIDYE